MTKTYQKGKDQKNAPGPGFRTPGGFSATNVQQFSKFGGGPRQPSQLPKAKFNPASFKTQHKG